MSTSPPPSNAALIAIAIAFIVAALITGYLGWTFIMG